MLNSSRHTYMFSLLNVGLSRPVSRVDTTPLQAPILLHPCTVAAIAWRTAVHKE